MDDDVVCLKFLPIDILKMIVLVADDMMIGRLLFVSKDLCRKLSVFINDQNTWKKKVEYKVGFDVPSDTEIEDHTRSPIEDGGIYSETQCIHFG